MLSILRAGLAEARSLDHLRLTLHTLGQAAELSRHFSTSLWLYAWAAWLPW